MHTVPAVTCRHQREEAIALVLESGMPPILNATTTIPYDSDSRTAALGSAACDSQQITEEHVRTVIVDASRLTMILGIELL
jgi:hypothetical protein